MSVLHTSVVYWTEETPAWISPKVSAAADRISMWFISRSVRDSHNLLRNTSVMYAWDDTDVGHGIACQVEDSRATSSVVKIEAKVCCFDCCADTNIEWTKIETLEPKLILNETWNQNYSSIIWNQKI